MDIEPVRRVLDRLGARYALIGGHAMAARGYPRFTVDVDLLTDDDRVLERDVWLSLEQEEATIACRRGDPDDPLGGVVHVLLAGGLDVDIIVARWKWEGAVIDRAESVRIAGREILVPRTSDLILLKLAAGGFLDLQDAAALFALGDPAVVRREVEVHLDEVRPDVRAIWNELVNAADR